MALLSRASALPEHECRLFAQGCRSGPGKHPEPGLFREGKRKGEGCTQHPERVWRAAYETFPSGGWVKGKGSPQILLGKLQLLNEGIQASSWAIVLRPLGGKWPVDSDWLPVTENLFKSDSTSARMGGGIRPRTLVSFIHSLPAWSRNTDHAVGPVIGTWGRGKRALPSERRGPNREVSPAQMSVLGGGMAKATKEF